MPNLIFNLRSHSSLKGFYNELDIAYYSKQKIDDSNNISVLKTSTYCLIDKTAKNLSFINNKNLEIFENSLIIGEVKSRFPKKLKSNKDKDKDNLEDIVVGLLSKLSLFYELYKKMEIIGTIQNIQLIFFYDTVQIKDIKNRDINNIILSHLSYINNIKNVN